jgi:hypothetical protein
MPRFPSWFMICAAAIAGAAAGPPARAWGRSGYTGAVVVSARPILRMPRAPQPTRAEAPRQAIGSGAIRNRNLGHEPKQTVIEVWPYVPLDDGGYVEMPVGDAAVDTPNVIVVGNTPAANAKPSGAEPLPDYSYVPGCRAIPNGYTCDTHQHAAAP